MNDEPQTPEKPNRAWIGAAVLAVVAGAVLGLIYHAETVPRPGAVAVTLPAAPTPPSPPVAAPPSAETSAAAPPAGITPPPVSGPSSATPTPPPGTTAPPPPGAPAQNAQPAEAPAGAATSPPAQTAPPAATATAEPTWLRNALPSPPINGRPMIAIVIDDLGLDRPRTEKALALKGPLTMSFMAYAGDLQRQTAEAHRDGHELIVHVPMEPIGPADMGINGLTVEQTKSELLRRLRWDLDRFSGYVGINNHMGSKFTGDTQGMEIVLQELKSRGLLFLDSRTIGNSAGKKVAMALDMPYALRDVFLDDEQSVAAVNAQLRKTEAIARKTGTAIAIGHPHDTTVAALAPWLASLPQKGIVLVPLSEIVKTRLAAALKTAGKSG